MNQMKLPETGALFAEFHLRIVAGGSPAQS